MPAFSMFIGPSVSRYTKQEEITAQLNRLSLQNLQALNSWMKTEKLSKEELLEELSKRYIYSLSIESNSFLGVDSISSSSCKTYTLSSSLYGTAVLEITNDQDDEGAKNSSTRLTTRDSF